MADDILADDNSAHDNLADDNLAVEMPALEILIAEKTFPNAEGARKIFDNFSLRVEAGGIVALLGPSGCGKSTLLRLIAGLDRQFSGSVNTGCRRPGMVFQEPRLLPWRNVGDNLRLVAPHLSETDLTSLLAAFELDGRAGDFPGQLSLGLARRVALARAFADHPDLLLLDEPFASLDRALHERLRALLARRIAARKTTTLIATHDLDDALLLADEIIFLAGAPAQVTKRLRLNMKREERPQHLDALRQQAGVIPAPQDKDV